MPTGTLCRALWDSGQRPRVSNRWGGCGAAGGGRARAGWPEGCGTQIYTMALTRDRAQAGD